MPTAATITEADIIEEMIVPTKSDLPQESARALLRLKFNSAATRTIWRLLRENNRGTIAAEDRLLLEKYLRVGRMLDLLQAKARLLLK